MNNIQEFIDENINHLDGDTICFLKDKDVSGVKYRLRQMLIDKIKTCKQLLNKKCILDFKIKFKNEYCYEVLITPVCTVDYIDINLEVK